MKTPGGEVGEEGEWGVGGGVQGGGGRGKGLATECKQQAGFTDVSERH